MEREEEERRAATPKMRAIRMIKRTACEGFNGPRQKRAWTEGGTRNLQKGLSTVLTGLSVFTVQTWGRFFGLRRCSVLLVEELVAVGKSRRKDGASSATITHQLIVYVAADMRSFLTITWMFTSTTGTHRFKLAGPAQMLLSDLQLFWCS